MFASVLPWPGTGNTVVTRDSGLQYIVLASGPADGPTPRPEDCVVVHYDGRLAETGEKFDASYDRGTPATFPAGKLIKGWVEALGLMRPGDEWMLYIPTDLGYGQNPRPGGLIKPGDDLVFRVAMQAVKPQTKLGADDWAELLPWDSSDARVQKTGTGLEFIVLEEGPADAPSPAPTDRVVVNYDGRLAADGTPFDASYDRCEPTMFPVNRVIPGWTEMLQLMSVGDRVVVRIPYDLAYGLQGTGDGAIPPKADLIFDVSLIDVLDVR